MSPGSSSASLNTPRLLELYAKWAINLEDFEYAFFDEDQATVHEIHVIE